MTSEDNDWELSSDESGSELSDLPSEYQDEETIVAPPPPPKLQRRSSRAKARASKEYRVEGQLKASRTTSYSAEHIFSQIKEEQINLNPEYQRDVVWGEVKQVGLIDSLLRNYYIPPVIFSVRTEPDGSETRTCIDGKQRLTSIFKFMNGEIYHKDSNKKYWYQKGTRRKMLPDPLIKAFRNKQISCVEYSELTEDQERGIFQRVQLGVPLTPAERMQSICGPWPDVVREIKNNVMGKNGFGDNIEWDRTRGREFSCIATILHLIWQKPKAFPGTPQIEKFLQDATPISDEALPGMLQTFRIYKCLAEHPTHSSCFQNPTRVSPMEVIMAGVLIHTRRAEFTMTELSSAICKMRQDVRRKHADVRSNGKVAKTMRTFIEKTRLKRFLDSDPKGDPLMAVDYLEQWERDAAARKAVEEPVKPEVAQPVEPPKETIQKEASQREVKPKKTTSTVRKRKRTDKDKDSDDEPLHTPKFRRQASDSQRAKRSGKPPNAPPVERSSNPGTAKKPRVGNRGVHSGASPGPSKTSSTQEAKPVATAVADSLPRPSNISGLSFTRKSVDRLAPLREAKKRAALNQASSSSVVPTQSTASGSQTPVPSAIPVTQEVESLTNAGPPLPTPPESKPQFLKDPPQLSTATTSQQNETRTRDPRRPSLAITQNMAAFRSTSTSSRATSSASVPSTSFTTPSPLTTTIPLPSLQNVTQPLGAQMPGTSASQPSSFPPREPVPFTATETNIVVKRQPTLSPSLPPKPLPFAAGAVHQPKKPDVRATPIATPTAPRALRNSTRMPSGPNRDVSRGIERRESYSYYEPTQRDQDRRPGSSGSSSRRY